VYSSDQSSHSSSVNMYFDIFSPFASAFWLAVG
jgi:hypothetical protein